MYELMSLTDNFFWLNMTQEKYFTNISNILTILVPSVEKALNLEVPDLKYT